MLFGFLIFVLVARGQTLQPASSCANVRCNAETACVESQDGPKCVKTSPKPGLCPLYKCAMPLKPQVCENGCKYDSQCPGIQKCCTGCGCGSCLNPQLLLITCKTMRCSNNKACVETQTGPKCVDTESKPGLCPLVKCAIPEKPTTCKLTACTYDSQCSGTEKCCKGCHCGFCFQPPAPLSCKLVKCAQGLICVDDNELPKCVKPGSCPASEPGAVGVCVNMCESDVDCKGDQKCCGNGCGRVCKSPVNPTCDSVKCDAGYECIMMSVMCIRDPCPALPECVKTCLQPAEPGSCKGSFPSWYFDVSTRRCHKFIYGGCGGNSNRFSTKKECNKACHHTVQCPPEEKPAIPCKRHHECSRRLGRKKNCRAGQTCCKTPCGRRCRDPVNRGHGVKVVVD